MATKGFLFSNLSVAIRHLICAHRIQGKMKFVKKWTVDYFFVKHRRRAFCPLCNRDPLTQFKSYALNKHFQRFHSATHSHLNAKQREQLSSQLEYEFKSAYYSNPFETESGEESCEDNDFSQIKLSYILAYRIAKSSKSFSDGEFIKECLLDVVDLICPELEKSIDKLTLSRRTIVKRILEIDKHLHDQLRAQTNGADYYSISLDESCDIHDTAQLIFFIRGIDKNFEIFEEMLSLQSLMGRTTGEEMYNELKCMNTENIMFEKLENVSTDGCPSVAGKKEKGLVHRLKEKVSVEYPNRSILFIHCIIHQEVLCKNVLNLDHVTSVVIGIVN